MFESHINADDLSGSSGDWFSGHEELGNWSAENVYSPWSPSSGHPAIIGTPDIDAAHWVHQSTQFTCAVVSQQMILKDFGVEVSEAQLVYDAVTHGWLNANGTMPDDVGHLLEIYGVNCHARHGADVEALLAELAQGHKVIAGVDSGEIWTQDWFFEDWLNPNQADHAVVVTGLDMRDPHHPLVILNDPGDVHGAGRAYPLDEFLNAWADSGQMYVATDLAPGDLTAHSVFGPNFNADTGLYMDIVFWTAFLTTVLQLVSSTVGQSVLNASVWTGASHSAGAAELDAWMSLDDAARNNLFYAI